MLLRSIGIATALFIASAGAALLACGDDDSAAPSGSSSGNADGGASDSAPAKELTAEEKACLDTETAYCKRYETCDPFGLAFNWGDVTACAQRNMRVCVAELAQPAAGITMAGLPACANDIGGVACPDFLRLVLPASCGSCIKPKPATDAGTPLTLGSTCNSAAEECDAHRGEVCAADTKKCTARTIVKEGASCGTLPDGTIAACSGGRCIEVVAGGSVVCKADADYGSPCSDAPPGPLCAYPGVCTNGTCQPGTITCQ